MPEGKGWQSKDIITWMILIWGFYQITHPATTLAGACNYGPMTQTLQAPAWAQQIGQQFTMEGEQ
jgi:hypothetical protein